jgi:hypothetical protein
MPLYHQFRIWRPAKLDPPISVRYDIKNVDEKGKTYEWRSMVPFPIYNPNRIIDFGRRLSFIVVLNEIEGLT